MPRLFRFHPGVLGALVLAVLAAAPLGVLPGCKNAPQRVADTLDGYAVYRNRGFDLYRQGRFEAAAEQFREAASRRGGDVTSHYWWGTSLMNLGRYDDAQLPLEQAYAITDEDGAYTARILDRLAEVYFQQGRHEKLHAFLDEVTQRYHQQSRDFLRQAYYQTKTGDLDGAKLAFVKAANFAEEGDASPYVALADFYESVRQPDNAKLVLRYAYAIDPETKDVAGRLRGYGVVLGPAAGLEPPTPLVLP